MSLCRNGFGSASLLGWLSVGPSNVVVMEGDSATSDLAARRAAVEDACAALAGLDEVLYQAGSDELGPLLTLLDRLGMAADLGRVHVTAEAIARGETGTRGCATTPAQWVRAHAPSTRAGGAAQIVT